MGTTYTFQPDYAHAVPPGATLKETIGAKGMSQADLAVRSGLTEKTISLIINGSAPLTIDTANKLELVLGVPARFWNARELTYREALAQAEAAERSAEEVAWLKEIPTKELISRGYVTDHDNKIDLVRQCLKFFGVSSVETWRATWATPCYHFRGGEVQKRKPGYVAAWLRMGEIAASRIDCQPYSAARFREALKQIRSLTDKPASVWYPKMLELCAAAGVAVVFVKQISGASVSGATKWVSKSKALVMLSLKYTTDDHVWFSFFHEATHVLKHGKKTVFVEGDNGSQDEFEAEADKTARDTLIPPKSSESFTLYRRARQLSVSSLVLLEFHLGLWLGDSSGMMHFRGRPNSTI